MEIWKPVERHHGYFASSLGRIKGPSGSVLSPRKTGAGYLEVKVRGAFKAVSRLVCFAFHGDPPAEKPFALHFPDADRKNNRPENLRWGSAKENTHDRKAQGSYQYGAKNPKVRLTPEQVESVRRELKASTHRAVAKKYGVSKSCVTHIAAGRNWPLGTESA